MLLRYFGLVMKIKDIQKLLGNKSLEEYLRENIFTYEEKKEFNKKWDNLWINAIYRNFEDE